MEARIPNSKVTAQPKISAYEQAHNPQRPSDATMREGQNRLDPNMPFTAPGNVFMLPITRPNSDQVSSSVGGRPQCKRLSFEHQGGTDVPSQHSHIVPDSQDRETLISPTPAPKRRKTSKALQQTSEDTEMVAENEEHVTATATAQASQTLSPPQTPMQVSVPVDPFNTTNLEIKKHELERPVYPPSCEGAERWSLDMPIETINYLHMPLSGFLDHYTVARYPFKMERGGWLFEIPEEWRGFNTGNIGSDDFLFSIYDNFWFNLTSAISSGKLGSGVWCSRGTGILAMGPSSVLSSPKTNLDSPSIYVSCWGGQIAEVHAILSTMTETKFDQIRRVWIAESDDKICIDLPALEIPDARA